MNKFLRENWRALILALSLILMMSYYLRVKGSVPLWIIREEIIQTDILFPDIVFAQAILESGWGSCRNCALSNYQNVFGFSNGKYLVFIHWRESIAFYKKWQEKRYSGGDYFDFLKRCWGAPDMDRYIGKLKSVITKISINQKTQKND